MYNLVCYFCSPFFYRPLRPHLVFAHLFQLDLIANGRTGEPTRAMKLYWCFRRPLYLVPPAQVSTHLASHSLLSPSEGKDFRLDIFAQPWCRIASDNAKSAAISVTFVAELMLLTWVSLVVLSTKSDSNELRSIQQLITRLQPHPVPVDI